MARSNSKKAAKERRAERAKQHLQRREAKKEKLQASGNPKHQQKLERQLKGEAKQKRRADAKKEREAEAKDSAVATQYCHHSHFSVPYLKDPLFRSLGKKIRTRVSAEKELEEAIDHNTMAFTDPNLDVKEVSELVRVTMLKDSQLVHKLNAHDLLVRAVQEIRMCPIVTQESKKEDCVEEMSQDSEIEGSLEEHAYNKRVGAPISWNVYTKS